MHGMKTNGKTSGLNFNWYWIAVVWAAIGVFDATNTVVLMRAQGMHHAWAELFASVLATWLFWAAATPVILWMGQRYPLGRTKASGGNWLRHLAAFVAIGTCAAGWVAALEAWLNPWTPGMAPEPFLTLWERRFYGGMPSALLLYGAILVAGWWLESRERIARQETEAARMAERLTKAQLSALRQQVEPHFLFNTLNTVTGLVREGRNDTAVDVIAGLSELLRHALKTSDRQQVALEEELELLERYLEIEKVRFAERLSVVMDVPEELRAARVPSLILQPIVENAVKHGIARRVEGGTVAIGAERRNGSVRLSVYNDGPPLPEGWQQRGGIGLENVRERLESLYGPKGELRVENDGGGVKVTVTLPAEAAQDL